MNDSLKTSGSVLSKIPKGHTCCFRCRKPSVTRDGDWKTQDRQQVFLCKICKHPATAKPLKTD